MLYPVVNRGCKTMDSCSCADNHFLPPDEAMMRKKKKKKKSNNTNKILFVYDNQDRSEKHNNEM